MYSLGIKENSIGFSNRGGQNSDNDILLPAGNFETLLHLSTALKSWSKNEK